MGESKETYFRAICSSIFAWEAAEEYGLGGGKPR
jgi:hypothetical protein